MAKTIDVNFLYYLIVYLTKLCFKIINCLC